MLVYCHKLLYFFVILGNTSNTVTTKVNEKGNSTNTYDSNPGTSNNSFLKKIIEKIQKNGKYF